MTTVAYTVTLLVLPGDMTLLAGQDYKLSLRSPLMLQAYTQSDLLEMDDLENGTEAFEMPYALSARDQGFAELKLKLLGFIPVKTVKVRSIVSQQVIACGSPIGIKLKTNGVVVIHVSGVVKDDGTRVSPAESAGILAGDILLKAGSETLTSIRDLTDAVQKSDGKPVKITYKRNEMTRETDLTPIKSGEDNQYRLGIWVRDSSAGIGTLTFIDPKNSVYGALGHGINDIDTGSLLQVGSGQLLKSNIRGIKMGQKGTPGELEGEFLDKPDIIGDIEVNSDFGVFGVLLPDALGERWGRTLEIGSHSMVHVGKASILTCIQGQKVEEYEIEIQRIARTDLSSTKNLVLKITDKRLLDSTGGIVQGMSGSPILQDGRLIGAVTHVFINDPTRGYGVFIESMLDKSNNLAKSLGSVSQAASGE